MDWNELHALVSSLWVVWFAGLFVGICAWAIRPSRRASFEQHAHIPLRDGE